MEESASTPVPVRKQERMVTLRLPAEDHEDLINRAGEAGLSLNSFIMKLLGYKLTVPESQKPRGRKPRWLKNAPVVNNPEVVS